MTRQVKNMAVLFADISDSASLYQKLGDASARNIVNACLTAIVAVLPRYEGRLVKTIGDAVMCTFPSADLAVLAASEMQSLAASGRLCDHPVMIHVGLHYGPTLIEDGDIFGDTVNAAAYLTAVAMAEQILTTEGIESGLSPELKSCVRPIFHAVLKGNSEESTVYQVLWRADNLDLTDVNLQSGRIIPGDMGSLMITLGQQRIRIDQWHTSVTIGRATDCDLVINDKFASRHHLSIKLMRTNFYLIDHSINGTFVTLESGEEVHVLRGELLLDGSGKIYIGRSRAEPSSEIIAFNRDRRSMYRV